MSHYKVIAVTRSKNSFLEIIQFLANKGVAFKTLDLITPEGVSERDAEIVRRFQEEPHTGTIAELARENGISRQRVFQILEKVPGLLEEARKIRITEREAAIKQRREQREKKRERRESMLQEAARLVREEKLSLRKAIINVGFPEGSVAHFISLVSARVKAHGGELHHGRWRNFEKRHARVKELIEQGVYASKIIRILRAEGDNISMIWLDKHYPNTPRKYDITDHS